MRTEKEKAAEVEAASAHASDSAATKTLPEGSEGLAVEAGVESEPTGNSGEAAQVETLTGDSEQLAGNSVKADGVDTVETHEDAAQEPQLPSPPQRRPLPEVRSSCLVANTFLT